MTYIYNDCCAYKQVHLRITNKRIILSSVNNSFRYYHINTIF